MATWNERRRENRRHRIEAMIADEQRKLAAVNRADYPSEGSYLRATAHYEAKIRRLKALLRDWDAGDRTC